MSTFVQCVDAIFTISWSSASSEVTDNIVGTLVVYGFQPAWPPTILILSMLSAVLSTSVK